MHQLILDLQSYPSQYSVFAFGESIHYIDTNNDFDSSNLFTYLEKKNIQALKLILQYQRLKISLWIYNIKIKISN